MNDENNTDKKINKEDNISRVAKALQTDQKAVKYSKDPSPDFPSQKNIKGDKKMYKAYQASSEILKEEMRQKQPEDLKKLKEVKESDIIVIAGSYDHGERVFELTEIPFTVVSTKQFDEIDLRDDQIVFINCPGHLSTPGIRKVVNFVDRGGLLVTTDWALKYVLEIGFPDYVRYNRKPTTDDVVRVEFVQDVEDKFLEGLIDKDADPVWWLEGSSYPIEVLDNDKVTVLVKSKEMKEKYGEEAIVVTFECGEGKVYHLTSHFYLQRTETRTARHKKSSVDYVSEKGVPMSAAQKKKFSQQYKDVKLSEVESAYSTQRAMANIVVEQRTRVAERKAKEKPPEDEEEP